MNLELCFSLAEKFCMMDQAVCQIGYNRSNTWLFSGYQRKNVTKRRNKLVSYHINNKFLHQHYNHCQLQPIMSDILTRVELANTIQINLVVNNNWRFHDMKILTLRSINKLNCNIKKYYNDNIIRSKNMSVTLFDNLMERNLSFHCVWFVFLHLFIFTSVWWLNCLGREV